MISVEGLVFDYPGVRALDGVSFSIEPGGITALVGPNGAGKTTLMRCMAALDAPFAGRVLLEGFDVHEEPRKSHREMGYLSDFFGLYDDLTVRQCLDYRAMAQGVAPAQRVAAAERVAAQVRLSERMGQKAGELSRGLRQRLAIAQAIIHRPRFLLLDEPASGLDPEARQELSGLLRGLSAEGMTILVSSHILAELQDYSTDMLILNEGRVVDHRAIEGAGAGGRLRMMLRLSRPDRRLAQVLGRAPGVDDVRAEDTGAEFFLEGGEAAAGELLRHLVDTGLAVCEFAPSQANLQDAYLERMRGGDGQ
ncbi:MAG: ABC transporter ATP-binding protein [Kiloniellales bacterium]